VNTRNRLSDARAVTQKLRIDCAISKTSIVGPTRLAPATGLLGIVVNTTKVLENVLTLAPTTLEMGLTPLELLHLGPGESLQQQITDLVAARDVSDRYSSVQIVSSVELNFLLDAFSQSGRAPDVIFKLRELLNQKTPKPYTCGMTKGATPSIKDGGVCDFVYLRTQMSTFPGGRQG